MRHTLTAIASLALAWPCHGVEPYDVLRTLANWEWELADIDDPGDADLLVPPPAPNGAVSLTNVCNALETASAALDKAEVDEFDRYYDTITLKFPLASRKGLEDPDVQWVLNLESPIVTELEKQNRHPHWHLGDPADEVNYTHLIRAIQSSNRATQAAMTAHQVDNAAKRIRGQCESTRKQADSVSSNLIYLLVTITLKGVTEQTIADHFLPFCPLENRHALESIQHAHRATKLDTHHFVRSIEGEHRFFVHSLNKFMEADDLVQQFINLSKAVNLELPNAPESILGRKVTQLARPFILQPNRTRKAAAVKVREALNLYHLPMPALWNELQKGSADEHPQTEHLSTSEVLIESLNGNALGDIMLRGYEPAIHSFSTTLIKAICRHDLTQLALAIRLYQADHDKALPDSLEKLVPDYLPQLPIDPFANRPYGFKVVGDDFVLWGVGEDGEDQKGELPRDALFNHQTEYEERDTPPPLPSLWFDNDIILRLPILPKPYPAGD